MNESVDNVVHPGGCYMGDHLMHCSLEEVACNGLKFLSHRELSQQDDQNRCFGSAHPHDNIGMCASSFEDFHCAGHPSSCALGNRFVQNTFFCSTQFNHFPERKYPFTFYPMCSSSDQLDSGDCVWSKNDCPGIEDGTNTFVPVSSASNLHDIENACTCDKVKVGACVHSESNYWACAVSADSCDKDSDFITWQEVESSFRDCRLCAPFDKTQKVPKFPMDKPRRDPMAKSHHSCKSRETKVAFIVSGGLIGIMLLTWIATRFYGRVQQRKSTVVKSPEDEENDFEPDGLTIS